MNTDTPTPATLVEQLARSTSWNPLIAEVIKLCTLNQALGQTLDSHLIKHCRVARFTEGLLTLIVPSPAVAHTFRFLSTECVQKLQSQAPWQSLKRLKVLVSSPIPAYTPASNTQLPALSQASAELLRETAKNISALPLKQALLRLSAHSQSTGS